jgi:phage-related protein
MKKYLLICLSVIMTMFIAFAAFAQDLPPVTVTPVLSVIQMVISFVSTSFPKAGPIIQFSLELIASLATFFTLLTVFVSGVLHIPMVIARYSGAVNLADKLQKIHDKIVPYLKYASIFNAPKSLKK